VKPQSNQDEEVSLCGKTSNLLGEDEGSSSHTEVLFGQSKHALPDRKRPRSPMILNWKVDG
jgi:hypothetical protein